MAGTKKSTGKLTMVEEIRRTSWFGKKLRKPGRRRPPYRWKAVAGPVELEAVYYMLTPTKPRWTLYVWLRTGKSRGGMMFSRTDVRQGGLNKAVEAAEDSVKAWHQKLFTALWDAT